MLTTRRCTTSRRISGRSSRGEAPMKRPLLVACLLVGSAVVFAQAPQNPNYKPSGPAPTGPGDPEWRGQTIQSGTLPPDTGGMRASSSLSLMGSEVEAGSPLRHIAAEPRPAANSSPKSATARSMTSPTVCPSTSTRDCPASSRRLAKSRSVATDGRGYIDRPTRRRIKKGARPSSRVRAVPRRGQNSRLG